MKNVKFDARGYIEIDGLVYGDPEHAKLALLGEKSDTVAVTLEGEIREHLASVFTGEEGDDVVSVGSDGAPISVPPFGNVKAFFDL